MYNKKNRVHRGRRHPGSLPPLQTTFWLVTSVADDILARDLHGRRLCDFQARDLRGRRYPDS